MFESGATYYLEAQANDFRPGGTPSRSRPIVLRVKSAQDIALADGDPLEPAFAELKLVIAAQEKATRLTANVKTYLDDIIGKRALSDQAMAIGAEQNDAISHGRQAVVLFDAPAGRENFQRAAVHAGVHGHDGRAKGSARFAGGEEIGIARPGRRR